MIFDEDDDHMIMVLVLMMVKMVMKMMVIYNLVNATVLCKFAHLDISAHNFVK